MKSVYMAGLFNTTKQRSGLKDLLPTTMDKNDVEFLECQNILPGNLCFLTGDTRGNENPGLTTMHTSWVSVETELSPFPVTSLKPFV